MCIRDRPEARGRSLLGRLPGLPRHEFVGVRAQITGKMKPPLKQIAALPIVETAGGPLVLLITTRGRGRWTIPRGWPKPEMTDAELAAQEAVSYTHLRAHETVLDL